MESQNNDKKIIILTGAYRGLGAILAKHLSSQYSIWAVCRKAEQQHSIEATISNTTHSHRLFHGDLKDDAVYQRISDQLKHCHQQLHAIIHCAGAIHYSNTPLSPWNRWQEMFEENVKTTLQLLTRFGHGLNCGRVILFGFSGNATPTGYRQIAAYAAAKEALIVLARSAAKDFAHNSTTVNVIAPGVFQDHTGSVPGPGQALLEKIPLARYGQPADITGVVEWILGPGSAYVTGQVIKVTGGLHIY